MFDDCRSEASYVGEMASMGAPEFKRYWQEQIVVFDHILSACSRAGGRIMTIHSRRASTAVLERLEAFRRRFWHTNLPRSPVASVIWSAQLRLVVGSASVRRCFLRKNPGAWFATCRTIVFLPKQTGPLLRSKGGARCHGTRSEQRLDWHHSGTYRSPKPNMCCIPTCVYLLPGTTRMGSAKRIVGERRSASAVRLAQGEVSVQERLLPLLSCHAPQRAPGGLNAFATADDS